MRAYAAASSNAPWAQPKPSAATEMRPPSRISRNWWNPCPRGPSRFPSGTRQPAKLSSRVSDERHPILCSGADWLYPSVPFSTTMFEISSAPVRAVIVTSPEISTPALVMNILEPSITHSPSFQPGGRAGGAGVGAGPGLGQPERG